MSAAWQFARYIVAILIALLVGQIVQVGTSSLYPPNAGVMIKGARRNIFPGATEGCFFSFRYRSGGRSFRTGAFRGRISFLRALSPRIVGGATALFRVVP